MIIKPHKILFVHIPKTAGQTLYGYIYKNLKEEYKITNPQYGLIDNDALELAGPQKHHHLFLDEYVELGYTTLNELRDYYIFSIVRNPIKRFLSAFYFNKLHKKYNYSQFLEEEFPKLNKNDDKFRHFCPQKTYIDSDLHIHINAVYKIEDTLDATVYKDLNLLKGFSTQSNIIINKNKMPSQKMKPLTDYDVGLLKDFYAEDFEYFSY